MRGLSAVLLLAVPACVTYWGEPNPTIVDDAWAAEGCEQHGGTCGGGFFGGCPHGTWRTDESLVCSGFEVSCCFPADAALDAEPVDAEEGGNAEAGSDAADGGEDALAEGGAGSLE